MTMHKTDLCKYAIKNKNISELMTAVFKAQAVQLDPWTLL